MDTFSYG